MNDISQSIPQDSIVKELNPIYGLDKNGKIKIWKAHVFVNSAGVAISYIEHGQLDGKLQITQRAYTEGKNIGKKNETSPLTQCIRETEKKWLDKKEKESYVVDLESLKENNSAPDNISGKIFPMLAHKYEPNSTKKKKNDIVFPCYAQPKLDGVRNIVYLVGGEIKHQSRTGLYFENLHHISAELAELFKKYPHIALDGELYTNEMPFEELVGLVKTKELSDEDATQLHKIKYHIYDVIDVKSPDNNFAIRNGIITKEIPKLKSRKYIEIVATSLILSEQFKEIFTEFIENGYEGVMLRNINGVYRQNFRSHDLQKYKEFFEDEYQIIGFEEGEGRDQGTVKWVCKSKEGKEFKVRPRGTIASRKELFKNGDKYIGKMLTVIYQELTEDGKPRFPVGKAIRDGY